ncbi:hypothetical protein L873DRAFT_1260884 [Choiromyces venosus 120613-1]|uniref:Uncharacterized protein n=1 Tax=Choiromyces venosus 120613-1 TaxID=1336337 RepID=A0A3N4JHA1_9PEZI|nr:hypothetical protein L873DRAFT_1260884 [Choiromyces venosus 120613-1]
MVYINVTQGLYCHKTFGPRLSRAGIRTNFRNIKSRILWRNLSNFLWVILRGVFYVSYCTWIVILVELYFSRTIPNRKPTFCTPPPSHLPTPLPNLPTPIPQKSQP